MGLKDIQIAFEQARSESRPAFMPYWPLGYPDQETSLRVIEALVAAGVDMIEVGVPFSDPLADGPVIQRASQIALEHGISVQGCIDLVRSLRDKGIKTPMLAMGYLNPLLAYGDERYVSAWQAAGADGLIIPDLPPEESADIRAYCAKKDIALVQFTSPTSPAKRLALGASYATGFVYVVSVTGVTGVRDNLAAGLRDYVERVKAQANGKPVAVGFGISKPEHVREIGQYADGVIIGAALIRAAGDAPDPAQAAYDFARSMMAPVRSAT